MLLELFSVSLVVLLHGRAAIAQGGTPCQSVSSMSAAYVSIYPEATVALVPADAAVDCLKSVPVDVNEDKALIEEMLLYLNWQSTLAYLRNPPKGYSGEQVDVVAELKKISNGLDNGQYADEYTLMLDLSNAFARTYDFHSVFFPDILQVFRFRRGNIGKGLMDEFAIVSVSSDGKAIPELYNYYDIMVSKVEGWTPSPITLINSRPAEEYVQDWSANFVYHEDHARYNQLFPNQALNSMGEETNQFGRSHIFDGDYTTVEYKNGSISKLINSAMIPLNALDGVEDGNTFFQRFCNLGPPRTNSKKRDLPGLTLGLTQNQKRGAAYRDNLIKKRLDATKAKRQSPEPTATGFPAPQILHSEAIIGGYTLSGRGYDDVAVLSIPSFSPKGPDAVAEFQNLVGQFLEDAVSAGKKRLVIDLRGNGGGSLFLGYDLFKQLFPSMDPGAAQFRFRANEAFQLTGEIMSELFNEITYDHALADYQLNGAEGEVVNLYKSIFNYKLPNNIRNENFTSWEDYFGPHEFNGDKFTTVARWDLNNFFSDDLGMDITGYASRANFLNPNQPFEASNMVILHDGACGSTCAVFSEFAKFHAGVQSVVLGGKPEIGPMQGVAGSKGSQVYSWTQVRHEALLVYDNLPNHQEELNSTELGQLVYSHRPLMRSAYQANGDTMSSINLRDNIRMNDPTQTPLEFIYEAADCRVFYTADMIRDVDVVWKKAVDARWGDSKKICIENSVGHKSSLSGGTPTAGQKKGAAATVKSLSRSAMAAVVSLVALLAIL